MSASRIAILLVALAAAPLHADTPAGEEGKRASVTGFVTLDGKPLAGARVIFHLGDDQFVGGKTDANGSYKVKWVPVGTHKITVELFKEGKSVLPARYSEEKWSALQVAVREGMNRVDFSLRSR
jgi:hypothetical protein